MTENECENQVLLLSVMWMYEAFLSDTWERQKNSTTEKLIEDK